jgi:hypothetical protein
LVEILAKINGYICKNKKNMDKLLSDEMIYGEMRRTTVEKGCIRTVEMKMSPSDVRDYYERLRQMGELFSKEDVIKALSTFMEEDDVRAALCNFSNKVRLIANFSTI